MSQQVNLYLPELRPRKEWILSAQALWVACVFVALLLALSVWGSVRNASLANQLTQLQQQLVQLEADVTEANRRIPASRAALIQQEVDKLALELASRERIHGLIHQQNLGNSDGFNEPLLAMARQHQPDLSLSAFTLAAGGRNLFLQGQATNAEALPQYLQRLQTEQSLQATRFGRLMVEREGTRLIAFSTGPESQQGGNGR